MKIKDPDEQQDKDKNSSMLNESSDSNIIITDQDESVESSISVCKVNIVDLFQIINSDYC